jgi:hypothetical protein
MVKLMPPQNQDAHPSTKWPSTECRAPPQHPGIAQQIYPKLASTYLLRPIFALCNSWFWYVLIRYKFFIAYPLCFRKCSTETPHTQTHTLWYKDKNVFISWVTPRPTKSQHQGLHISKFGPLSTFTLPLWGDTKSRHRILSPKCITGDRS